MPLQKQNEIKFSTSEAIMSTEECKAYKKVNDKDERCFQDVSSTANFEMSKSGIFSHHTDVPNENTVIRTSETTRELRDVIVQSILGNYEETQNCIQNGVEASDNFSNVFCNSSGNIFPFVDLSAAVDPLNTISDNRTCLSIPFKSCEKSISSPLESFPKTTTNVVDYGTRRETKDSNFQEIFGNTEYLENFNLLQTQVSDNTGKYFFHSEKLLIPESHKSDFSSPSNRSTCEKYLDNKQLGDTEDGACFYLNYPIVCQYQPHTLEKLCALNNSEKKFIESSIFSKNRCIDAGKERFACEKCNKTYSNLSSLVKHSRTHTGEKPFACEKCAKRFNWLDHCVNHTRTHTGEKPFACEKCAKRFSQSYHLVQHLRTHTGEKHFACKMCAKRFSRSHHLVQHLRTHTGEKLFACDKCDKKFCHSSQRNSHRRTHLEQ